MTHRPRNPKEGFFSEGAGLQVIVGGLLIGLLTTFAFWYGYQTNGYSPRDTNVPAEVTEYARTMAFMTIISCQLFYSMSFRNHAKSIFTIGIFSNVYLIGAIVLGFALQLFVLGVPFMRNAFKLQMLSMDAWINVFALGLIPLAVNELAKIFMRVSRRRRMHYPTE